MVPAPRHIRKTTITKVEEKLSIATYNIENFSAKTDGSKVEKIAKSIIDNTPDIIGLVEVQDNDGQTDSGVTSADETYKVLVDKITELGGPSYEFTDIVLEDKQDGGAPGGNIRVGYLYNPARVSLANGGGIRASIDEGIITKGEVITVLPFGNYIQTLEVPGSAIKQALENGVSSYPEIKGVFPHVAGMTFAIDASKPAGERVHSMKKNGEPIDMDVTYTLATNDFLAAGGDEYTVLANFPVTGDFAALDEAVMEYIKKRGTIEPKVEGRIIAVATPIEEPDDNNNGNNGDNDQQGNKKKIKVKVMVRHRLTLTLLMDLIHSFQPTNKDYRKKQNVKGEIYTLFSEFSEYYTDYLSYCRTDRSVAFKFNCSRRASSSSHHECIG